MKGSTTDRVVIGDQWRSRSNEDLAQVFPPQKELLVRGKGCYVWAESGKQYLDFLGGIAVNALGHAHPAFIEAVSAQASTLAHISNLYASVPQLELAKQLKDLAQLGEPTKVIFANSGAETSEIVLKLARLYSRKTNKHKIIALNGAFHGRTMGALALTGNAAYRTPFEPLPNGVVHIDPTLEALNETVDDSVAAIFVEPILGEAGVLSLPNGFLKSARDLANKFGALLMVDEVQTGVGRTGTWFAHEHEGIKPDVITLSKGLGGGIPIGAVIIGPSASGLFYPGSHGSTFAGNALVCATSLAVLKTIEEDGLLQNVIDRSQEVRDAVLQINSPLIEGVRGKGLLLGIELAHPIGPQVAQNAFDLGLIVNAANPSVIRIAPPLIVGSAEIADFVDRFTRALSKTEADLARPLADEGE